MTKPIEGRPPPAGRPWMRTGAPHPLWQHVLLAVPVALVPSILLVWAVMQIAGPVQDATGVAVTSPPPFGTSGWEVFGVISFAPLVESFGVAALGSVLLRITRRHAIACGVAGLAWGLLHGIFGTLWFFGTAWTFVVLTHLYLNWRVRSFRHGYAAALWPHVLVNVLAMASVIWGD